MLRIPLSIQDGLCGVWRRARRKKAILKRESSPLLTSGVWIDLKHDGLIHSFLHTTNNSIYVTTTKLCVLHASRTDVVVVVVTVMLSPLGASDPRGRLRAGDRCR